MVEIEQDDPRPIALQLAMRIEDGMFVVEPVAIRLGKVSYSCNGIQTSNRRHTG